MKRQHVAALIAEFIGTFALALAVLNVSRLGYPFFTAIAAGVTLAISVSVFGKISGSHINPAVTIGLFSIRQVSFVRTVAYIVAQVLGAVAAWQIYEQLSERTLKNISNSGFDWRIFTAEALGALIFGIAVTVAVTQKYEGYQNAYTQGAGLFVGLTIAGLASLAILNPAVAVGVRSVDVNYVLGPIIGFLVGANLYAWVLNPVFSKKASVKAAVASPVKAEPKSPAKKAVAKKASSKKAPAKKAKK